ncbi:hypothetical protein E2C01_022797 [Portunus trituberculatus]|uniref:Uncharacterized protein n=1 Tax=Portunus trituberculatus TaxID=210409 RepID=A0A5B7E8K7_PORTR|nr:hypothetical protein [Portunus trituberculatus]
MTTDTTLVSVVSLGSSDYSLEMELIQSVLGTRYLVGAYSPITLNCASFPSESGFLELLVQSFVKRRSFDISDNFDNFDKLPFHNSFPGSGL